MAQVLLKDIIDHMMLQFEHNDHYLHAVSRTQVIYRAKRLLQELNYAGLRSIRLTEAEVMSSGKVGIPADFVEYVRVFYCVGNYLIPAFFNDHINTLQWNDLKDIEERLIVTATGRTVTTPGGSPLSVEVRTGEHVRDYGSGESFCFLKGYKYDEVNRYFVFDHLPCGVTHVLIEYVSDPLLTEPDVSKLGIHKYFEKAIEAGIYLYLIEPLRNVPMNEKTRAKREWNTKYRDAKIQLGSKPEELIQALLGWKHMLNGCFPGMGGQSIPKPPAVVVVCTGIYGGYVCQHTPEPSTKMKNMIRLSAEASVDKVVLHVSAEQEVYSDVRLAFVRNGMQRSVEEVFYYVLEKGKKIGRIDVDVVFYDSRVASSIYSVGGVVNMAEDDVFVYETVDEVYIPGLLRREVVHISASASADSGAVVFTSPVRTASSVVIGIVTDGEPLYRYAATMPAGADRVSVVVSDEMRGRRCVLSITSADGIVGSVTDKQYQYEVDPEIDIPAPDVPGEKPLNLIRIRPEIQVWRMVWRAVSAKAVTSEVRVRVISDAAPDLPSEVRISAGSNTSGGGAYYIPFYGSKGHGSVIGSGEDADYRYVVENADFRFLSPDDLSANDWRVTFRKDGNHVYAVVTFDRPVTSDIDMVFDYGSATANRLFTIRRGETSAVSAFSVTKYIGRMWKVYLWSINGVSTPSGTIVQGWDLVSVYPFAKEVLVYKERCYITPILELDGYNNWRLLFYPHPPSPSDIYIGWRDNGVFASNRLTAGLQGMGISIDDQSIRHVFSDFRLSLVEGEWPAPGTLIEDDSYFYEDMQREEIIYEGNE